MARQGGDSKAGTATRQGKEGKAITQARKQGKQRKQASYLSKHAGPARKQAHEHTQVHEQNQDSKGRGRGRTTRGRGRRRRRRRRSGKGRREGGEEKHCSSTSIAEPLPRIENRTKEEV